MIGEKRDGRNRGERRGLRCALFLSTVVCRSHGRGNVSGWSFYVGTRGLAVGIGWRLRIFWRMLPRWSWLLHGRVGRRACIAVVVRMLCFIQFVGGNGARLLWGTGRAAGDALVLHRRDHGIIGGRHRPLTWGDEYTRQRRINYTWDESKMEGRLDSRDFRVQELWR